MIKVIWENKVVPREWNIAILSLILIEEDNTKQLQRYFLIGYLLQDTVDTPFGKNNIIC